jgi:hypothetical protein
MDSEKKRAPWVPALIEPPDPLAPLEEWPIAPIWMRWRPGWGRRRDPPDGPRALIC